MIGLYFSYDKNVRPHAVTEVKNADGKIPGDVLATFFNDFGKIQLIEDAGKGLRMDFGYGPDRERWYSELSKNGSDVRTTVYAGEYEKVTENGKTREFYYLDGNTIVVREDGVVKPYYLSKNYFGAKWLGVEILSQKNWQFYYPSKDPSRLLKFIKFGWKGLCI